MTDAPHFNQRSTWWIVTAYDKNLDLLESYEQPDADRQSIPRSVKAIHGGVEICPSTGRRHYQCAIECNGQQRAVFFRDWLPRVHFEIAKNKDAVKQYCLKADTAAGLKGTVSNPVAYLTMDKLLMQFAEHSIDINEEDELLVDTQEEYWRIANRIIMKSPALVSMIAVPTLRTVWQHTRRTWRALVLQARKTEIKIESLNTIEDGIQAQSPGTQVQAQGDPPSS